MGMLLYRKRMAAKLAAEVDDAAGELGHVDVPVAETVGVADPVGAPVESVDAANVEPAADVVEDTEAVAETPADVPADEFIVDAEPEPEPEPEPEEEAKPAGKGKGKKGQGK